MSCTIQTIISCDGAHPNCHGNDASADMSYLTAAQQRAKLRVQGWKCTGPNDYCPACRTGRSRLPKKS